MQIEEGATRWLATTIPRRHNPPTAQTRELRKKKDIEEKVNGKKGIMWQGISNQER